jgi:hypothetical protein
MTHFPHTNPRRRATRIKFGDSVSVLVLQQDGSRAKGKLQTISVTGGLVSLPQAMSAGDLVEVGFQTDSGPVHGMAEMLAPISSSNGALQPFRFIALADEDHRALRNMVDLAFDRDSVRSNAFHLPEFKRV